MDAVGSAIRVDSRGREVMRILPRVNEAVNEEWISDKTRFVWDGLRIAASRPALCARAMGGSSPPPGARPSRRINAAISKTSGDRIGAIAGDLAGVEEMYRAEAADAVARLGQHRLPAGWCGAGPGAGTASYLFNPTIDGIEQADAILIVGANPRFEASVLNARIRKRWRAADIPIARDRRGGRPTLRLRVSRRGRRNAARSRGRQWRVRTTCCARPPRPMIIVGQGALAGEGGAAVLSQAAKLAEDFGAIADGWNGFAVLHNAASRVGGLDIGFVPGEGGKRRSRHDGRARRTVSARRRRARYQTYRQGLHDLCRHPWRQGRASRRRDPARARPIPRNRLPTSTPRAGCR